MTLCETTGPACVASWLAMAALGGGLLFAVLRLLRGPSTPDRVVALDLVSLLAVGFFAVYAVMTGEAALLSAALIVGLMAFLGTVAFARYLEGKLPP